MLISNCNCRKTWADDLRALKCLILCAKRHKYSKKDTRGTKPLVKRYGRHVKEAEMTRDVFMVQIKRYFSRFRPVLTSSIPVRYVESAGAMLRKVNCLCASLYETAAGNGSLRMTAVKTIRKTSLWWQFGCFLCCIWTKAVNKFRA